MKVRFRCPHCDRTLSAPTRMEGRTVDCPSCKLGMVITNTNTPNPPIVLPSTTQTLPSSVTQVVAPQAQPQQPRILQPVLVVPPPVLVPVSRELVKFHRNGSITLDCVTVAEAKIALKLLRTQNKQYALDKKEVMQEMREIRQAYSHVVRQRGSKFIGGGSIGRVVRVFQTVHRDDVRRELANQLQPWEKKRAEIEARVQVVELTILDAERLILANS